MNASRMRRDGRNAFCPEDTPEEHLARVGRNLYGYGLECFKQGWGEEAQTYETAQAEPMSQEDPEEHVEYLQEQLEEAKTQLRVMLKAHKILEEQNARMLKVLTKFGKVVTAHHDSDADTFFKGDQGSESREFSHGRYCGRTDLANDLYEILMEKE